MAFLILLALIGLAIIGFSAYAIAEKFYRSFLKKNESTALLWSAVIFIASFGFISVTLLLLLLSSIDFGR